jgi:hypothetical protein
LQLNTAGARLFINIIIQESFGTLLIGNNDG